MSVGARVRRRVGVRGDRAAAVRAAGFEALERRRLMATIVVSTLADSGAGSLRQAIASANAGDTIDLSGLSGTITLSSTLSLTKALTFAGPGADALSISGNDSVMLFDATSTLFGGTLTFSDLTLTDAGTASTSYGVLETLGTGPTRFDRVNIRNCAARFAMVIASNGDLSFTDCNISGNTLSDGQRMMNGNRQVSVLRSTFYGNAVTNAASVIFGMTSPGYVTGGLLSSNGNASIVNSTFANNTVTAEGTGGTVRGGLVVQESGALTITNSTFAGNTVTTGNAGSIDGATFYVSDGASMTLTNTIVADTAAGDPFDASGSITSGGNNLISGTGRAAFVNGANGDIVGTLATPVSAGTGSLSDNGGATRTVPLLAGSPSIKAGDDNDAPATDQRGQSRVGASDIGAFEFAQPGIEVTGNGQVIAGGDTTPSTSDHTDFGQVQAGWSRSRTFTVTNTGAVNLTISGVTGLTNFAIDPGDPIAAVIAPGQSDTFTVRYAAEGAAGTAGTRNEDLSLVTNAGTTTFRVRVQVTQVAALSDGVLLVNGTDAGETIRFVEGGGSVTVQVGDEQSTPVPLGDVQRIEVFAGGGDDRVELPTTAAVPAYVFGDAGRDTILGGPGRDTLSGGGQGDVIYGGAGVDRVNGNGGNDKLFGEADDDRLYGNDGNDTLDGGLRVDRLWGGAGDDLLLGKQSADKLYGEAGDDTLVGSAGPDFFSGGDGTDSADATADDYTPVGVEILT